MVGLVGAILIGLGKGLDNCINRLYICYYVLNNKDKNFQILIVYVTLLPLGNNINWQVLSKSHQTILKFWTVCDILIYKSAKFITFLRPDI